MKILKRVHSQSEVMPHQVSDMIKEIQDTIYNVSARYLGAKGWDLSDIADYFVVEVTEAQPGIIRAEIRGELSEDELFGLMTQLDRAIAVKFDEDAYFDAVEPGIAEAFIRTNVEACSNVSASDTGRFTMQDVQDLIDGYGTKYFEAIPMSDDRELWFSVFDVGSYHISIVDGRIMMIPLEEPNEKARSFRTLKEFSKYLERQIAICKQEADMDYSVNASTDIEASGTPNRYSVEYKIGDKVRFDHGGGNISDEIATISGYDSDGFYMVTWDDGEISEGLSDAQLVPDEHDAVEMSTRIKAYTFDESEDGWGEEVEGILSPVFARAEDLMYEVRNTVRGANTDCETTEDLADFIRNLATEFEEAADEIDSL